LLHSRDWTKAPLPDGRRLWRVPAVFDTSLAPHLAQAAAQAGVTPDQAIADFCAAPLRVQTIGFAPGQPYLGTLPAHWDIPRQTALNPQVPMGALVVAIRQMVLFSVTTPTGWQHVGQTALRLFQPEAPEPFLLRPGDEVLFTPVAADAYPRLQADLARGGATCERLPA
jgi:KipI family sensor histidine kinase inhibitor